MTYDFKKLKLRVYFLHCLKSIKFCVVSVLKTNKGLFIEFYMI